MKAEIYNAGGITGIKINGDVYSYAATRSFRPEGRILHDFARYGFKFFNVFPSGIMTALGNRTIPYSQFGPVWTGDNKYDWENLRAQCNEFFENIGGDAYVSLSVHLDPPQWYVDSHPGMADHWEQMMQNIGSDEWKTAAAGYMYALIDKMEEWYPQRVYAIFLLCGGTTEWYSYHPDEILEHPSQIQQDAYRRYMKDDGICIPPPEVLHHACDGVLRDRIADKKAVDYWRFTNTIVTDTILYFAKAAKEHTKNTKLVGLFNGHIYGQQLDWAVRTSYNEFDRLLNSEYIDMIFCPASYTLRKLDSTSGIRVPVDSITQHGKLYVHEIDSSTYLLKKKKNDGKDGSALHAVGRDEDFSCTNDSKMYIRREAGIALAKGQGYWWFDMFSGYYDDPELMEELKSIHKLQDILMNRGAENISEVTEMLDGNSNYYIKTESYYPMPEHQTEALNRAGAPWDQRLSSDMFDSGYDKDKYKLYIFPTLFAPDAPMRKKVAELRGDGKCIFYMHAPGYCSEDGFSTEAMEKLTGIRFERLELTDNMSELTFDGGNGRKYNLVAKKVNGDVWPNKGAESQIGPVFTAKNLDIVLARFTENGKPSAGIKFRDGGGFDAFSACAPVPVELIKEIYRYAGIFSYADEAIPLYTNDRFSCVYSSTGGEYTLYRPAESVLTDYVTGEKFRLGPKGTKLNFMPHETKLLLVDAADTENPDKT